MAIILSGFRLGKTRSAPWRSTLWVLVQPVLVHFFALGHCRNAWFPCKQENHNLFSAEIFARCVGVFSLNTELFHKACFPLQRIQEGYSNFFSTVLVEAKTLVTALVLDGSSTFGFPGIFFIYS